MIIIRVLHVGNIVILLAGGLPCHIVFRTLKVYFIFILRCLVFSIVPI